MRKAEGVISVFLALSSVLIFALLGTCLEGARAGCTDYLTRLAAESSVQSVFAAYQGELRREYGLLLCRGRTAWRTCWQEEAQTYAEKYLAPGAGLSESGSDRIRAVSLKAEALESVFVTEGQGLIFIDEVTDYMKSAGLSILLKEVLERLGLYSEEEGFTFLNSLKDMLSDQDASPEGILSSYQDLKEQAAALQELAAGAETSEEEEAPAPQADPPAAENPEMKADLLEQIQTIRENGLIAVITGTETLSTFSWDDASLASRLPQSEKNRNTAYPTSSVSLLRHFLMGEYLLGRMGSYTDRKKDGAQYEIEYVLTGRKSDKAAFEMVVGEILLIRMGFNMAYLITDAEKQLQAESLALTILSLLALPELTVILKWLLLTAWALAESIVDVKVLLKGKKLPLIKTKMNWQLSTLSLDLSAGNGTARGLTYEDYLRLLFYLGDPQEQAYRMMDVMEKRLRLKVPAFQMREYMVYAAVSVSVTTAYLYIQAPALNLTKTGKGRKYTRQASFAYGRR